MRNGAPEQDRGRGTHTQAALRFCARAAMQVATDAGGGAAHVVLCTDGHSTLGARDALELRHTVDRLVFDVSRDLATPVQIHALMMGEGPNRARWPASSARAESWATPEEDTILTVQGKEMLTPVLYPEDSPGTLDLIAFARFVDETSDERVELATTC